MAAVGHGDRVLQGAPVQDFVPADDRLSVLAEEIAHPFHEEGLELLHRIQPEDRHQVLAVLALQVGILRGLVAADMVQRRREQLEELGEDILQEPEGGRRGGVQVLPDAPTGLDLVGAVREAAQFGISRDGGRAVAGDLHFGDHGHAAPAGVFHDLADVVLGVETAVRDAVADPAVPGRLLAPGPDLGEAGILVDLDAPALVLGQVPVEHVLLVHRHQVDELHDLLLREEEAAAVEQGSTVPESGFILDGAARDRPFLHALRAGFPIDFRGKELQDGLQAIEGAVHFGSFQEDAVGIDLQPVGFQAQARHLPEHDRRALSGKRESRRQGDLRPEVFRDFRERVVLDHQGRRLVQDELPGGLDEALGQRDDVIARRRRPDGNAHGPGRDHAEDPFRTHHHSLSMVSRIVRSTPSR